MTEEKVRLHITPFSPNILKAVLSASASAAAGDISFHTVQTFPENNYGYLELPSMEAEKIRKKLNGSILKGHKVRVEEARPRKRRLVELPQDTPDRPADGSESAHRLAKRAKKDRHVVLGYELPHHRKVKRGWTEPKQERSRRSGEGVSNVASSKYTNKEELLFRTKVPPNKASTGTQIMKGSKKKPSGTTVHEFEKSNIQPSFLRNENGMTGSKRATEYVNGRGWINENGELIEEEDPRLAEKTRKTKISRGLDVDETDEGPNASDKFTTYLAGSKDVTQYTSTHDEEAAGRSTPMAFSPKVPMPNPSGIEESSTSQSTSSEGSSSASISESDLDSESMSTAAPSFPNVELAEESSLNHSHLDGGSEPQPNTVHPLEELFKRPRRTARPDVAKPSLEVQTSFSFFDPENDDAGMPETPFSSQDFRARGLRSAAPTPDTAAPSRQSSYWEGVGTGSSEEVEEEEVAKEISQDSKRAREMSSGAGPSSDFSKWFWEHRGESNRAWKRRRREGTKEKRQREKRQGGRRIG